MRSWLYVPADKPKMLINAGIHGADGLIFDLEDSIAPADKYQARILLAEALGHYDFSVDGRKSAVLAVRVNSVGSAFFMEDLELLVPAGAVLIRLPKIESAEEISEVCSLLDRIEASSGLVPGSVRIQAILETPLGVENAFAVAGASKRLTGLSFGAEDYCTAAGINRPGAAYALDYPRSRIVSAAAACGIEAWDTVWANYSDMAGLQEDAQRARNLGFSGKSVIHPTQIGTVNRIFSPSPAEIEWADRILNAALDGAGTVGVDGMMIDRPVVERARRIAASGGRDV